MTSPDFKKEAREIASEFSIELGGHLSSMLSNKISLALQSAYNRGIEDAVSKIEGISSISLGGTSYEIVAQVRDIVRQLKQESL